MEISKGIRIVDTALWFEAEKILIINDLHIGFEEALHHKGVLVPKSQLGQIKEKMDIIFKKVRPKKVIINGDLKHEFGRVLRQEWKEVLEFLDFLLAHVSEVIIIKGNHDPVTKIIAEKRGIVVAAEYKIGATLIVHGDELVETKARRIVIGHEHPAVTLREGSKLEKYKCFLKGKWKGKELIAVPSFNPLLEGTDILRNRVSGMPEDSPPSILKEELLSPFLKNIKGFEVYVVGEKEAFAFGKVNDISQ